MLRHRPGLLCITVSFCHRWSTVASCSVLFCVFFLFFLSCIPCSKPSENFPVDSPKEHVIPNMSLKVPETWKHIVSELIQVSSLNVYLVE